MKIFGVGRNFGKHAQELGNELPTEPVIFSMPDTALLRANAPFYFPDFTKHIDYEVEIVVRVEKEGKNIPEKFAHKYYSQIALGIDFTARDLQDQLKAKGLPWTIAKGFNHSAPISEFINLEKGLEDMNFSLKVNDELRQAGNTNEMTFSVDQLIAYISTFFMLKKGDLIYTGTPAGVGPIQIGDRLEGFIENHKLIDFEIK